MRKGRWIVYGLAAAAGIAFALPFDRRPPVDANEGQVTVPTTRVAAPSPVIERASAQVPAATVSPKPAASKLYANQSLELEPLHAADGFVGYVVVRSHDPRLSVGDVVTAVGGQQVEEGAAGSELLIAALRNPGAELTVQQRADWSPEL